MLTLLLAITTSTSPSHLFQHSTESFKRYPRVDRRPSEHIHPGSTDDGEKYVNTNTRPKPHCETLAATIWCWCGWLDEKPEVISRQRATQARSMEEKMLYSHSHKTFFQFFSVDWRNSVKPGLSRFDISSLFGCGDRYISSTRWSSHENRKIKTQTERF